MHRSSPSRARRRFFGVLVLVIVLVILYLVFWHHAAPSKQNAHTQTTQQTKQPAGNPNDISLYATGDWIAHDSVNAAAKQSDGNYNYLPLMSDFGWFKNADIRFCNDPILNGGAQFGISGYPKFNSPTAFVDDMGKFGCNLVNTASNHSFDRGQAAITASVNAWSQVPNMLAVAGENANQAQHDAVHYFTVKGVKFAFLAYTTYINTDSPAQNGYGDNVFSPSFAAQQIAEAKAGGAQIIIASMRWGTEYSATVTQTQKNDAQFLADHGVALVLGHGTHVLQPVVQLTGSSGNKTTVWYGLGNFINTQLPADTLFDGIAVVHFDAQTKQVTKLAFVPTYMHYAWTPAQAARQDQSDIDARSDVHMYLLKDTTQQMIDAQQLKTAAAAQRLRMVQELGAAGQSVQLVDNPADLVN